VTFVFNIHELMFVLICIVGGIVVIAAFILLFADDE
jgi:hypothetical protein